MKGSKVQADALNVKGKTMFGGVKKQDSEDGALGCVVLLFIVVVWVMMSFALEEFTENNPLHPFFLLLIPGLVIGGVTWVVLEKTGVLAREREIAAQLDKMIPNYIESLDEFVFTTTYITNNKISFVGIDEEQNLLVIGGLGGDDGTVSHKCIHPEDILAVDIVENGKGLKGATGAGASLGGAAIGGILFGGAGAVVGAVAGTNTKAEVYEISLRILVDDVSVPYLGVCFLSGTTSMESEEYQELTEVAEKWYAIVKLMIAREKRSVN